MKIKINSLVTLCFLLALFPYNSLFIFSPSDIQPWAGIVAAIIFLSYLTQEQKLSPSLILLLLLPLAGLFYNPIFLRGHNTYLLTIRSLFGYFTGPLIFFVFSKYQVKNISKVLRYALSFFILLTFIEYVSLLAGRCIVGESLVGIIKWRQTGCSGGGRGISSIFPEPSFLALTASMYLLLYSYVSRVKNVKTNKLFFLLLLLCVFFSYSGTILVLVGAIIMSYILSVLIKKDLKSISSILVLAVISPVMYLFFSYNFPGTRFVYLADRILNRPETIFYDGSIYDRFFALYISFKSFSFFNAFGAGAAGYNGLIALELMNYLRSIGDTYMEIGDSMNFPIVTTRIMSAYGNYVFDFGLLGGLIILFFLINTLQKTYYLSKIYKNHIGLISFFFISIIWMQSLPVAHPLPWLILGVITNPKYLLARIPHH